jgi:hypothetical protein
VTIRNCDDCGGDHFGSLVCPFIEAPTSVVPPTNWLLERARKNLRDAEKTVERWQRIVDRRRAELADAERTQHRAPTAPAGEIGR